MRNKIIVKSTTNRGVFNRTYKIYLEQQGKIHCSFCGYNRGENDKRKWYGGIVYDDMETCHGKRKGTHTRYPNWKLVSKNSKQWMKKTMIIIKETKHGRKYIDIKF
jgi:hypothetical protein